MTINSFISSAGNQDKCRILDCGRWLCYYNGIHTLVGICQQKMNMEDYGISATSTAFLTLNRQPSTLKSSVVILQGTKWWHTCLYDYCIFAATLWWQSTIWHLVSSLVVIHCRTNKDFGWETIAVLLDCIWHSTDNNQQQGHLWSFSSIKQGKTSRLWRLATQLLDLLTDQQHSTVYTKLLQPWSLGSIEHGKTRLVQIAFRSTHCTNNWLLYLYYYPRQAKYGVRECGLSTVPTRVLLGGVYTAKTIQTWIQVSKFPTES
jgi:hypothetical protein